jgi:catechol 2,3-dioxygenase-like lactoylglutathione lyase family enzyme
VTATGVRLGSVVLDCPRPQELARFYADLLGAQRVDGDDDWADVTVPDSGVQLSFQRVTGYSPPQWPDGVPQQFHLDLVVTDFTSQHDRVVRLGATALDPTAAPDPDDDRSYRVYADPAGHPFCLCLP